MQVRGLLGEHRDDLVEVAIGHRVGHAMVASRGGGIGAVANQRSPSAACQKQVSALLRSRVSCRWRSACNSWAALRLPEIPSVLVTRHVGTRAGRAMRWKPALDAFAIMFEGCITPTGN